MSVTNYTPNSCQYKQLKLKDVVYLVSKSHIKNVIVDEGICYIASSAAETPMALNCFNVQFTEEESLDERYKFIKRLTFSMNGYVPLDYLQEKYYAIIETEDNTRYMVNVDFPSKVTYTFTLDGNSYQTDFTFSSQSNFPTLLVNGTFQAPEKDCGYKISGIEDLYLVEKNHATISKAGTTATVTLFGKSWMDVDFLKDSCSIQEVFDGERITDTISFDIGFDNYKTSWHYNLLEFLENLYAARIISKGDNKNYFFGFNFGLQPSYNINASSSDNGSGKITVTLTESSSYGLVQSQNYVEHYNDDKQWVYVQWIGNVKGYECVSFGVAQYLVKREVDGLGNPTGNYKVYSGLTSFYSNYFNVVGEFDDVVTFESNECSEADGCILTTDMPSTIYFSDVSCKSYSLRAECNWSVYDLPEYITITPSSGVANTSYTLLVCNTETPTDTLLEDTFMLRWGNNEIVENVNVGIDYGFIRPTVAYINCLAQNVIFKFNENCQITVTSIDPSLSYNIGYSKLTITVPFNSSSSAKTWSIEVKNCINETQTLSIIQDQMYTRWATVSGFLCESGASYTKQEMFSGTTSSDTKTSTSSFRKGTLIQSGDSRCQSYITRWSFLNHYYCVDGNKYKALEEEISYDDGATWTKTGVTKLGELVEQSSEWCNTPVTYEWRLSTKWQCDSN